MSIWVVSSLFSLLRKIKPIKSNSPWHWTNILAWIFTMEDRQRAQVVYRSFIKIWQCSLIKISRGSANRYWASCFCELHQKTADFRLCTAVVEVFSEEKYFIFRDARTDSFSTCIMTGLFCLYCWTSVSESVYGDIPLVARLCFTRPAETFQHQGIAVKYIALSGKHMEMIHVMTSVLHCWCCNTQN